MFNRTILISNFLPS